MKKTAFTLFVFLHVIYVFSQVSGQYQGVSIAEDTLPPHPAAILDVRAINKGILIPCWTTQTRKNSNPQPQDEGLTIFVNDPNPDERGYWYWVYVENSMQGYWRKLIINRKTTYPPGSIIMYHGSVDNFDESGYGETPDLNGWALCDGLYGRPDLSGMFVVGGDSSTTEYDTVNVTGGQNTATIGVDELPVHEHKYTSEINANAEIENHTHNLQGTGGHSHKLPCIGTAEGNAGTTHVKLGKSKKDSKKGTMLSSMSESNVSISGTNIDGLTMPGTLETGSVTPVNKDNRPPYYVVAFIICIEQGDDFNEPVSVPDFTE